MRSESIPARTGVRIALSLIALGLSGCYAIRNDYRGDREMTPGTVLSRPSEVVGTVEGGTYAWTLFFGLLDLNSSSGVELLERRAEERGLAFDGLTEIRIRDEADLVTILTTVLTLGMVGAWWVEGDAQVVRTLDGGVVR